MWVTSLVAIEKSIVTLKIPYKYITHLYKFSLF